MRFLVVFVFIALETSRGDNFIQKACLKHYPADPHVPGTDLDANQKCIVECALRFFAIMDSNGNINITRGLELNKLYTPETVSTYEPMYPRCKAASENAVGKCEKAYLYVKCFGQEAIDLVFE